MSESINKAFRLLTWLFLLSIVAQVFFAGMVVVAGQMDWNAHEGLGHMMGFLLIPMLILMYVGKANRETKILTWILFLVWFTQAYVLIIFLRQSMPLLAAFHPVLALADFWLALRLLGATKVAAA